MIATQVLAEDPQEKEEDDGEETVGFLIIDDKRHEIKKGETKIGRDPTVCSVVIDNFTVSKVHAVVESEGIDDTFIYDVNSTNQTKLGKKVLKPHCRYKLEDESKLTFGNISAKFILPHKISNEAKFDCTLENFSVTKELDDIFEIATQVSVPQPCVSGKVLQLESENFQIFKIPTSVTDKTIKESPLSSKGFASVPEDHSNLKEAVLKTECYNNSLETSDIFSLQTQCRVTSPLNDDNKCEDKVYNCDVGINESDKVKSLLNDGADDVLCTFMTLHSPSGRTLGELQKKIKTEIFEENLTQLFEKDTQIQSVLSSSEEKNVEHALQLNTSVHNQNLSQQSLRSVLQNDKTVSDCNIIVCDKKNETDLAEEDSIKTQEFKINPGPVASEHTSTIVPDADVVSNDETDLKCYFEETIDCSITENVTDNEDQICTQKFVPLNECPQKNTEKFQEDDESNESKEEDLMETQPFDVGKETSSNVPETEEELDENREDLETQIFDFEKEKTDKEDKKENEKETAGTSKAVSESSEKNIFYVEEHIDSTQRDMEEDLICTQAFNDNGRNNNHHSSETPDRNDEDSCNDDEDFILTQPLDLPANSNTKNKWFQDSVSKAQTVSRESSPDILGSDSSERTFEDVIHTQTFEDPKCKSSATSLSEFSEQINSMFSSKVKKEVNEDLNFLRTKIPETVESSGDETESDLEIIFEKSDKSDKDLRIKEFSNNSFKTELQVPENSSNAKSLEVHENDESNSSYVFQLEREDNDKTETAKQNLRDSDSDATDCEEIAIVNVKTHIKQESSGNIIIEETQNFTLSPPNKSTEVNCFSDGEESPKFEIGNQDEDMNRFSLVGSDSQNNKNKILVRENDTESQNLRDEKGEEYETPSKIKRTEVGTVDGSTRCKTPVTHIDSPLKRPGNSYSEMETTSVKKFKSETSDGGLTSYEKQFLKLWQAHDIELIQPNKTRNSLKSLAIENKCNKTNSSLGNNISNQLSNSLRDTNSTRKSIRKCSSDITSYLCKKTEKNKIVSITQERKNETGPEDDGEETELRKSGDRVLRSSRSRIFRESPKNSTTNRPRRSSRFKNQEYFSNSCVNVVFTGFECESLEKIISNLGGTKTNDLPSGDVVVAEKVRRTVKFLCAIGLSLPITSPEWLMSCKTEKRFLNPWNFLLKDEESERKWDFELKASLEKSKKTKLMKGLNVFATKNTKPPVKDLLAIVECCGGTPLFDPPDIWPKKTVIVSCEEDKKCWPIEKSRNIKIVHYEFILSGVLRQKLDYRTYKLR